MTTPPSSPLLGTPYILSQSPSSTSSPTNSPSTQSTKITPTLCTNLSAFKSLLRSSRQLDDSIILRLNRSSALVRGSSSGIVTNGECETFWKELLARWEERGNMMRFCDEIVRDGGGEEQRERGKVPVEKGLMRDAGMKGRGESEVDVKRRQIHNEIKVESIVRARSLAFFVSRCPNHSQEPSPPPLPLTDLEDNETEVRVGEGRRGRDGRGGVRWNG